MGFSYNPGITNQVAAYNYAGMDALGQGIQGFLENQRKYAEEAAATEAMKAKNQVLFNHLSQLPPSPITGKPYLTQDDMLAFYKGSPKQQEGIMSAAAANAATDTALQNQQFINQGRQANTGYDLARTGLITNPPRMQAVQGAPLGTAVTSGGGITPTLSQPAAPLTQVPVLDQNGVPTGRTAVTGGNLPHTVLNDAPFKPSIEPITGPNNTQVNIFHKAPGQFEVYDPQGNRLELTDEEKQAYTATGKIPLRTSSKSFVPESALGASQADAVKQFDNTIGKQYGFKSADLYKVDFTTPGSIKYADAKGNPLSTEQVAQMGTDNVKAVIPVPGSMGMTNKTLPLTEWNTIVNKWQQLPKAGDAANPGATIPGTLPQPAAPTNAAATTLGPSTGGYKAGYTYGGKVYLGGDPMNPASWSK
jgi:hypothetical protein